MATGDTLERFTPLDAHFPGSNPGTLDFTALPAPVIDFDDTTDETVYFVGWMPGQYDGTTGLTVVLVWKASVFSSGATMEWEVSFYRVADDADSYETATFAAAQPATGTNPDTTGELDYATVNFSNAQADGVQPNELFILRVVRDASVGTLTDDAELAAVEIKLQ